jgi:hypothetical protein
MPEKNNFLAYHKSIAKEINVTKNRIRHLIGSKHWLSDGEHKEAVLRKVLRNHLPESVRVGKGFVCFENATSTQIDILITACDKPTLFKDGELVLVTPDSVQAVIEVKTSFADRTELNKALTKLSDNIQIIRTNHNDNCLAGLFVYDRNRQGKKNIIHDEVILEELQNAAQQQPTRVINWIALGPDRFFRYWENTYDVPNLGIPALYAREVWHSYELTGGLAHAYFLSNVIWDISEKCGGMDRHMQYAWFPVGGTKERFRRWCIPLTRGVAQQFDQ